VAFSVAVDRLKGVLEEMDRTWKSYVALHVKRVRLESEVEKLSTAIDGPPQGVEQLDGDIIHVDDQDSRRERLCATNLDNKSSIESMDNELKSIRSELDELDEKITKLKGAREYLIEDLASFSHANN
jgi:predicted  nucleic acid-binding Zn-ribbon protein